MQEFDDHGSQQQEINGDPREQRQIEQPYEPYYIPGSPYGVGEKLQPERRRRRKVPLWAVIFIMGALGLAVCGGASILGYGVSHHMARMEQEKTFAVFGQPSLSINDPDGSVRIHSAGGGDQIIVHARSSSGLFRDNDRNLPLQYQQNGNAISITTQENTSIRGDVELDVALPSTANVTVHTDSGDIGVYGMHGSVATTSSSGDVEISHSAAQVNMQSSSGDISIERSTLEGQSRIQTNSGSVDFSGTLDPNGSYAITTNSGSVDMRLPTDASFQLDMHSNSGSLNNDFDGNAVGNAPRPPVSITTDSGSIDIGER